MALYTPHYQNDWKRIIKYSALIHMIKWYMVWKLKLHFLLCAICDKITVKKEAVIKWTISF